MGRKKKFTEPRGKANMINVTLYPADEAIMAEFISRHNMTKREFIARLIAFFGKLEPGLQEYMAATVHPELQQDIAKILLEQMATRETFTDLVLEDQHPADAARQRISERADQAMGIRIPQKGTTPPPSPDPAKQDKPPHRKRP